MLSERERRFVDAFMGEAKGNGTKAAILSGYRAHSARIQASKLLAKGNIQEAIAARVARLEQASIADATERRERLTRILRNDHPLADAGDSIRAIDLLNKMDGLYIERHEHSGVVQVVASAADARL